MYSYGPPHMTVQKQDDQLELTYSNYVRTQDVTLKTCRRRWMIGRSGERGSGISVLRHGHDDDDDDDDCSSTRMDPASSQKVDMPLNKRDKNQTKYKRVHMHRIQYNSLCLSASPFLSILFSFSLSLSHTLSLSLSLFFRFLSILLYLSICLLPLSLSFFRSLSLFRIFILIHTFLRTHEDTGVYT